MANGRGAVPDDPLRGLEPDSRAVLADLLRTSVAWVDLPTDWEQRRRVVQRMRNKRRLLSERVGHPVGCTIQREPDGDGLVFFFVEVEPARGPIPGRHL